MNGVLELEPPTVHIAYYNRSMCAARVSQTLPPPGHRCVPMTEHYKATCNECFHEWTRFYDDE